MNRLGEGQKGILQRLRDVGSSSVKHSGLALQGFGNKIKTFEKAFQFDNLELLQIGEGVSEDLKRIQIQFCKKLDALDEGAAEVLHLFCITNAA